MSPPTEAEPHVELREVRLRFGARPVFDGLSARFARGEIHVLLGGSGAGKSTLLRLVGGLLRPDAGSVRVAGEEVAGRNDRGLVGVRAKLGMMFQGGALLDSLTVFENLALPLRERLGLREPELGERIHTQLGAVGLEGTESLLPGQLSGGMMKRAALARALVQDPEILLCDEPFSGLDPITTRRIEALLTQVNDERGMTILVASHHIPSTLRMADQILLLMQDETITGSPDRLRGSDDARVQEFLDEDRTPHVRPGAAVGQAR